MLPVTFESQLGFLHPARGDCGIVLCSAFGHEQLCAATAWRALADQLATAGFPVLRFDWMGTGDSLGADTDSNRVKAWRAGLDAAIALLKAQSGVERVALVGLRLGALFALEAATRHESIVAVVLMAAPPNGRAYVRETRATARLMAAETKETPAAQGLDAVGYHWSDETLRDVEALTLAALPASVQALVLSPAGHAGTETILRRIGLDGATATALSFDGYADFLSSPTFTRRPQAAFDTVTDWLASHLAPRQRETRGASVAPASLHGPGFREAPVQFGPGGGLFGIFCAPADARLDAPAVVFVNSGGNPHAGWARNTVDQARALAAAGIASLRFDVAGLGDSAPRAGRRDPPIYDPGSNADVDAALTWLVARGHARAVLVGLCSGAHLAFHAGCADKRVSGIVMLNLLAFVWPEGRSLSVVTPPARSLSAYLRDAATPARWREAFADPHKAARVAGAFVRRLVVRAGLVATRLGARVSGRAAQDVATLGFQRLTARGGRALVLYSVGDSGLLEFEQYMGRGGARLAQVPGVELAFLDGADHALTPRPARDAFTARLIRFVTGGTEAARKAAA